MMPTINSACLPIAIASYVQMLLSNLRHAYFEYMPIIVYIAIAIPLIAIQ